MTRGPITCYDSAALPTLTTGRFDFEVEGLGVATKHHHPTASAATTSPVTPSHTPAAIEPEAGHRTLDILVLEDDDSTRRLLDVMLAGLGHRVIDSKSVKEAKSLLTTFVFDLLLCDLSLPDGSGLEVAAHVPKGDKVYKIILSGHGDPEDMARSKAAGFDAHLVKPIDVGLLQREVWRLTGQPL